MINEYVGDKETKDINDHIDRILRDLGNPEPPLELAEVRELLRLDLKYYSGSNPTHIDELQHRLRVAGKQIAARPTLILDAIAKLNLSAFWLPDKKRILIDEDVPAKKHRWIEGHEICHGVIPWHSDFLFGDNKVTLSPVCDETIEAEANYAAGRLLFLGDRFGEDARDLDLNFKSIKLLAKEYGNTLTTTLWRIVESREPGRPVFGMISKHPKYIKNLENTETTIKSFIRSKGFRKQFGNVEPVQAFQLLSDHSTYIKNGPIAKGVDVLVDINGDPYEFRIEGFSNSYDILTYGVCQKKL